MEGLSHCVETKMNLTPKVLVKGSLVGEVFSDFNLLPCQDLLGQNTRFRKF